jgi:hypothetical protein
METMTELVLKYKAEKAEIIKKEVIKKAVEFTKKYPEGIMTHTIEEYRNTVRNANPEFRGLDVISSGIYVYYLPEAYKEEYLQELNK